MKLSKILSIGVSCFILCFAIFHAAPVFAHLGASAGIIDLLKVAFLGGIGGHGMYAIDGFVISDTTYAGEAAAEFILPAITGADTLDGGHAYLKDGIKKKFTIPRWNSDYSTLVQPRKATPTSAGEMDVDAQYITPEDYMIYMEFNPRDFEEHWYSQEMAPQLIDAALPRPANEVVIMGVMQRHAKYFNNAIWNSSIVNPPAVQNKNGDFIFGFFNGWLQKMYQGCVTAFPANLLTTAYTNNGALTAANIAGATSGSGGTPGIFDQCYTAIPLALRYNPMMKYFVSYKTFDLYRQYQVYQQTYKGNDVSKGADNHFNGLEVVKIADFPDNTVFVGKGMNTIDSELWVGINSVSDEGLKFAPLQANSELWFVKLLMKADVNLAWFQEGVYYGPVVS